MKPQLLVSATTAGSGKTLFTMGLLRALKRRGLKVQPYKCGSEFMDAQLLTIASDNESVNLDAWMATNTHVQYLYNKYGEQAEACVVEGSGGLFDGYRRMQGSSAEMAGLLNLPVVLLVNARVVGYSVAPVIYGFKHFYTGVSVAGVVFNQVSSPAHYLRLREACADAGVDCLGYLPVMESCKLPSRHSAISLANRRALDEIANLTADQLEQTVDVNRLLSRCSRSFPCQYTLPYSSDVESDFYALSMRKLKIAIARDPAFCFTYRENVSKLAKVGNIVHFSPLYGYELPEADLVYLPGGYPELFARQLHRRHKMMEALKEYAEKGGKILAEGGGMAFLSRTLKSRENGTAYPMSNILPFDFALSASGKVCAGYRKTACGNVNLKGYEFRYTDIQPSETSANAEIPLLYRYKNVIASPAHWYWGDKDIMQLWQ